MNRILIAVVLACGLPASNVLAAAFPWFHTRPKPVVLDEPPAPTQTRVAYHGTAVYPKSGRLYFEDAYDRHSKANASAKFHVADLFPMSWLTGSQPAKTAPRAK